MATLGYDPEYAAAMAPLLGAGAMFAKLPAGDVEGRRAVALKTLAARNAEQNVPGIKVTEHHFTAEDGAQILLVEFRKESAPRNSKAIYHIHGGGMIIGSVYDFASSIQLRADRDGVPIFSVDYRLAPEHPHPTPVGDCFAGLEWLYAHAEELGIDKTKIIIAGESAGGGLAAGAALMARDRKLEPPLLKQILIFPMIDDRNIVVQPHVEPFAFWGIDDNITGWRALLGDNAGNPGVAAVSEYAAPARAKNLAGLPPAYIEVGQLDLFCSEDIQYAARLAEAGVPVEFHLYPGVPHGFQMLAPNITVSKQSAANVQRAVLEA